MPHFYPIPTPIDFELPELFTNPFDYEPSEVVRCAASELVRYLDSRPELHDELAEGKMFGVLVVRTPDGTLGALYGFSGNLAGQ
ncbi:MAG: RNA pseudouridine synthase, partial [Rikenellaceae bacterium]